MPLSPHSAHSSFAEARLSAHLRAKCVEGAMHVTPSAPGSMLREARCTETGLKGHLLVWLLRPHPRPHPLTVQKRTQFVAAWSAARKGLGY